MTHISRNRDYTFASANTVVHAAREEHIPMQLLDQDSTAGFEFTGLFK
jgi:hypothetical protein